MREYIDKLLVRRKMFLFSALGFYLLFGFAIPSRPYLTFGVHYAMVMLSVACATVCIVIYFAKYHWLRACIKLLEETNREHFLDDINLSVPIMVDSKIYCGENAFFSKVPYVVIPYEDIAWIHPHQGNRLELVFHIKNGKILAV